MCACSDVQRGGAQKCGEELVVVEERSSNKGEVGCTVHGKETERCDTGNDLSDDAAQAYDDRHLQKPCTNSSSACATANFRIQSSFGDPQGSTKCTLDILAVFDHMLLEQAQHAG